MAVAMLSTLKVERSQKSFVVARIAEVKVKSLEKSQNGFKRIITSRMPLIDGKFNYLYVPTAGKANRCTRII